MLTWRQFTVERDIAIINLLTSIHSKVEAVITQLVETTLRLGIIKAGFFNFVLSDGASLVRMRYEPIFCR